MYVMVPVSNAGINLLFIDHFQDMVEGHFIIKRLEKRHGSDLIERCYHAIGV